MKNIIAIILIILVTAFIYAAIFFNNVTPSLTCNLLVSFIVFISYILYKRNKKFHDLINKIKLILLSFFFEFNPIDNAKNKLKILKERSNSFKNNIANLKNTLSNIEEELEKSNKNMAITIKNSEKYINEKNSVMAEVELKHIDRLNNYINNLKLFKNQSTEWILQLEKAQEISYASALDIEREITMKLNEYKFIQKQYNEIKNIDKTILNKNKKKDLSTFNDSLDFICSDIVNKINEIDNMIEKTNKITQECKIGKDIDIEKIANIMAEFKVKNELNN